MDDKLLQVLASVFYKHAYTDIESELDENEYQDITFQQYKLTAAKQFIKTHFSDAYYTLWNEEGQELHFDDEEAEQLANESRQEILDEIYKDESFNDSLKEGLKTSIDAGAVEIDPVDLSEYESEDKINWFGDDKETDEEEMMDEFEREWNEKHKEEKAEVDYDEDADMDDPNFGKPDPISDDNTDLDDL